ncbi:undecaprenyl-diphosphatase [Brevibacillus ruminantium]|uniref:Undecaprenyl-diphosphatase n=1 Tax=Brevibacillus ruminantium TaxID=2950604 RepID=A0ABY4WCB0_9BACL|nr:undecaprenyl-diphosphatase [Brevibacillus ruminantium]USG64813.1 undecaprenyl-diphosphatase [Brevibacillus ruminantium]
MSLVQYDLELFRSINDLGKEYAFLNPAAIFMAEYTMFLLGLGLIVYWFTRTKQNRMMVIQAVAAFVIAEVFASVAGHFFSHQQPFAVLPDVNQLIQHSIDNSFPSDHTILFFSMCFSFLFVRKREGWLWVLLALCVGISRILVGVHYPVDVVVGALLGILSACIAYLVIPQLSFVASLLSVYEKVERRFLPSKSKSTDLS